MSSSSHNESRERSRSRSPAGTLKKRPMHLTETDVSALNENANAETQQNDPTQNQATEGATEGAIEGATEGATEVEKKEE